MSLNGALQSGVSGLLANSAALSAISNNIANTNTVGFKTGGVDFQSIVASAGAANAASGGVTATSQQLVTQQGTTMQTASPTDLYISGQGLFVTSTTPTPAATSQVLYTRSGSFTPDANGFLKNSAGLYLEGVLADSQGNIPTSGLNISGLQPINVTNVGGAVSPTTVASLTGTLNATQPISAAAAAVPAATAGAYDPALNSMTAYNAAAGTGVKPDFTMQVPISDSQGGQHTIQVDLLKSSVPDQWYAEIQSVPVSDVAGGTVPGQISSGILAFNPDGSLDTTNTTLNTVLNFGASAAAVPAPPSTAVNWASSLGVAAQTVNLSLGSTGSTSGMSQVAGTSAVTSTTANGTPFGALSSIAIGSTGIVTATFTNGVSRSIAEIPLATFPNADGRQRHRLPGFQQQRPCQPAGRRFRRLRTADLEHP